MTYPSIDGNDHPLTHELLAAISHAVRVLEGGGDDEQALRESFRMASRGLRAERSFLAKAEGRRWITEVLESEGLARDELNAVRAGCSSPGLSVSLVQRVLESGRTQHVEDSRLATDIERTGALRNGAWSVVCAPVLELQERTPLAVLYFQTHSLDHPLRASVVPHVRSYALALACTWHVWKHARQQLRAAREELALARGAEIIGHSRVMLALREQLDTMIVPAMAAPRPDPILICGETGTGKGVVAKYLHAHSTRSRGPFVVLNSATLKGDLAEKALFGHVKGSYTGASSDAPGAFLSAHGGVLFLDEVGDMPPEGQALLLHVTERRSVRPVGGDTERPVDLQLIFATHVDLARAQREGRFRPDLYHRISALPVTLPALRDRPEDVPALATHLLSNYESERGRYTLGLTDDARQALQEFHWPGNVRQLEKVCRRLSLRTRPGAFVTLALVKAELAAIEREGQRPSNDERGGLFAWPARTWSAALAHFERAYLEFVGEMTGWNRSAMARVLDLQRKSLYRRMYRSGLMTATQARAALTHEEDHDEQAH